jgi:phage host-nuclease inhibitor protein Gam
MGYKDMISTWECDGCGTIHDDDSDNEFTECWKCDSLDRKKSKHKSELDDIRKEMKRMETEYKDSMKRMDGMLTAKQKELEITMTKLYCTQTWANAIDKELKEVKSKVKRLEICTNVTNSVVMKRIEDIKEKGTCLNEDNIRSVKKIARKAAIRQIVKWESD